MGRAKATNPQAGDLVRWKGDTETTQPWLVLDFFPWGCDGKHAWALQNTVSGRRVIAFRSAITRVEE